VSFVNDRSAEAMPFMKQRVDEQLQHFVEIMTVRTKQNSPVAPVRGGTNRRSIRWERLGALKFRVFTESGYGAYLELGTYKMAARPYFATAFRQAVAEFKAGR